MDIFYFNGEFCLSLPVYMDNLLSLLVFLHLLEEALIDFFLEHCKVFDLGNLVILEFAVLVCDQKIVFHLSCFSLSDTFTQSVHVMLHLFLSDLHVCEKLSVLVIVLGELRLEALPGKPLF